MASTSGNSAPAAPMSIISHRPEEFVDTFGGTPLIIPQIVPSLRLGVREILPADKWHQYDEHFVNIVRDGVYARREEDAMRTLVESQPAIIRIHKTLAILLNRGLEKIGAYGRLPIIGVPSVSDEQRTKLILEVAAKQAKQQEDGGGGKEQFEDAIFIKNKK